MTLPCPLRLFGRDIGTYTGWDGNIECVWFYDFVPNQSAEAAGILACDTLMLNSNEGYIISQDIDGKELFKLDIISTFASIPRIADPA